MSRSQSNKTHVDWNKLLPERKEKGKGHNQKFFAKYRTLTQKEKLKERKSHTSKYATTNLIQAQKQRAITIFFTSKAKAHKHWAKYIILKADNKKL